MRFLPILLLLIGSLFLGGCADIAEENRTFFPYRDKQIPLHFNTTSPGFIRSPYAPEAGLVDVRHIPPGTSVICPYTGKVFVVPADDGNQF